MLLSIVDFMFSYYARVSSFPFIIQLCIVFILSCILLFSFFFAIITFIRYQFDRKKRREEKLSPIIDELILKYLLEDNPNKFSQSDINTDFTNNIGVLNDFKLGLVTDQLIKYKNNFDLSVNEQYYKLISALRIEDHIEKKFNFTSNFSKMKGIQELSSLAITAAESNIFPFTYSPNSNIRKEARTSYIRLSKNDPFKFFDEPKEQINSWDQIKLMKYLMEIDEKEIPKFSKWITYSNNDSIVSFSIKMCSYFNQQEAIPVLIDYLKTNNHELRAEAIKALGDLKANESEAILKEIYMNQPDNCQVEIIKSIGKFNTGKSIDFLQDSFESAINTNTKKVAAESIYNYSETGKQLFNNLLNKHKDFNNLILQHIANPLIKFK